MNERQRIRISRGPDIIDEETRTAQELLNRQFTEHLDTLPTAVREALTLHELPKTEKELALLSFANIETNRLMEEAGVMPFEIPPEHCHVLPDAIYRDALHKEGDASSDIDQMAIFIPRGQTAIPSLFGRVVLHEMEHLKAHQSFHLHVTEANKLSLTRMRDGLSVHSAPRAPERHQHFSGLHEAIVAMRERMSFSVMLELPELAEEKRSYYSDATKALYEEMAEKSGYPADDIAWVEVGESQGYVTRFSYHEHRATLRYICEEIQRSHSESFESWEQVFKKFENAHYNGKLLELGRLIEDTFGKGSFGVVGDMESTDESARACKTTLEERRLQK